MIKISDCIKRVVADFFYSSLVAKRSFSLDCFLMQDVTVIFRRRGGDDLEQSHTKWAETVEMAPDVINMTFTPIVSLLDNDVPGIKHLTKAIDLYLECKTLPHIYLLD